MEGTMKKVVITGKKQAALVDMPIPTPERDLALVKIHVAPMCTEYKAWLHGPRKPGERIEALGHEGVGEVVEVAHPCGVEVGDRVVVMGAGACGTCENCRAGATMHCINRARGRRQMGNAPRTGAYAQYRLGTAWMLPKIPDDISWDHASMAWCGLGPTFGAMQTINVGTFDSVLITGAGPVGQGAIVNAKYRGARAIVVEIEPWRMERAKQLGADEVLDGRDEDVVDHIKSLTDGLGVTCAIECAGTVITQRLCIDATRQRGSVVFVAECGDQLPITVSPDMIRKGLHLIGQWHYLLNDFDKMMQLVRESGDILDVLNSHKFPMSKVQDALELSASHECGKITLYPWK